MYDERTNIDHMKFLIDDGMKECHGPALWGYNNALFTDKDFENITKLGGATKEREVTCCHYIKFCGQQNIFWKSYTKLDIHYRSNIFLG